MNDMIAYSKTDDIFQDSVNIIEAARHNAYQSVDRILLLRNWLLGKRIAEENMDGTRTDRYGAKIISDLAKRLTDQYGKGFDKTALYRYVKFYQLYPEIVATLSQQSLHGTVQKIVATASQQSFDKKNKTINNPNILSWSHYTKLLQVINPDARAWYEREAYEQSWSVRTLQRNIDTQYYERMLLSQNKQPVEKEMKQLSASLQEKASFVKNPYMLEFLGLTEDPSVTESKLESAIITNLQKFLMEMGKGFAFVARQQRIHTEKQDYYIDLVFYNYMLKCFVLIDLKMGKITHQDVGQMDMYVRIYDELRRNEGDNPTLGIVLCSETDEDIARYSVLHGNEQLFASKYKLLLPTEEQLRAEIETQKEIFYMQHPELQHL